MATVPLVAREAARAPARPPPVSLVVEVVGDLHVPYY